MAARFLTCLAACLLCVFIAVPAGAKAETKRVKNIKALVANMEGYERELLIGIDLEIGENRKLSLKATTKAQAKKKAMMLLKKKKMYENHLNTLSNTQMTVDSANLDCQIMNDKVFK